MGAVADWVESAWAWAKDNHDPLTVLLTLAGVLVAWRYVVLTRRLAEAANTQAAAARVAAEAAADQARTTRLIFEAQRPALTIHSAHNWAHHQSGKIADHGFTFAFENHGPVPAFVTRWNLSVRRDNAGLLEVRKNGLEVGVSAVPPQTSTEWVPALTEQIPYQFSDAREEPLLVEAKVTYQGIAERVYTTRSRFRLTVSPRAIRYVEVDTAMDEG